jgi:hypothetical protein
MTASGTTQTKPMYLNPTAPVPVKQFAQLDADVGDDAGHVRGANLRRRNLADQRVLQPHGEGQHQHRERHGKRRLPAQGGAHQPENQQQHRFDQQRQGVLAAQPVMPRPVHQNRRGGRAGCERQQHAERAQHQLDVAQHQVVSQHRREAGHVRGVSVNQQKATGVDGAGIEGQQPAEQPVGGRRAMLAGEMAQASHAVLKVPGHAVRVEDAAGVELRLQIAVNPVQRRF